MDQLVQSRFSGMRRLLRSSIAVSLVALLAACAGGSPRPDAGKPLTVAQNIDVQKLGGQWYLIAHVPYAEERDQMDSSIDLRPRLDGGFDEIYHYFDAGRMQSLALPRSRYTAVAGSNNGMWVSRSRALESHMDLGVLYVDPDYRYAVVGESKRERGWIYSRDPVVDPTTYQVLVAQLNQQGYDVAQLHRLTHSQVTVGEAKPAPVVR